MYFPLYNDLIYNIISIMCSYLYLVHLFSLSFSFSFFFFLFLNKLHQLSLQFYKKTITKTLYEITHPLKILWEGGWTQFNHSITLNNVKPFNIFYWKQILTNPSLDYIIFIYSLWLQNFQKGQGWITMSSIKWLKFNFL